MKKILTILALTLLMTAPAYADSATFHIADAVEEDTGGVTGSFNMNKPGDEFGWTFFGYYPPHASYYSAYWRWSLEVPRGSVINKAYIIIYSISDFVDPFDAEFAALEPDGKWEQPSGFSIVNYPNGNALRNIPHLGSPILWEQVPEWGMGLWYSGPDISDLVQTRIDSGAYDPATLAGGYFGLVLQHASGDGIRGGAQEQYSNEHTAVLYVEWVPAECQDAVEICGDGIDNNCDGRIDEFCNERPVADAGPDVSARVGDVINLDGGGSVDVDGDMLTYVWSLALRPEGSAATLSDPLVAAPSIMIDAPGDYVAELVVHDGTCESEPDVVTISTINSCPTAEAGPDAMARVGKSVTLLGAGNDPDGDALAYSWLLAGRPEGSAAELEAPASATPSLRVDLPGEYLVELTVDDGACVSEPDPVVIGTYNVRPVANAGPDADTLAGFTVALDGRGSSDLDDDALGYSWSILSKPGGSAAGLSDPLAPTPTLLADVDGEYIVQLIVCDGELDSEPDTCTIGAAIPLCPLGKGYWKNHLDDWPVESLEIGGVFYGADELASLLKMPVRGDASVILAGRLIAAKLNISSGSDPRPIEETIFAADALLGEYSGGVPCRVRPSTAAGRLMVELANELESYNSGRLTLACE